MSFSEEQLYHNVGCALLTVIYVHVVLFVCGTILVKKKQLVSSSTSRKLVHISASCWILYWPLFLYDEEGWSWMLNVTVPFAMTLQLFYKGAILKDPDDPDVISMSRNKDPSELLCGPIQFTLCMTYLGIFRFRTQEAILIMSSMGIGDGIAPLIGSKFGKTRYKSPPSFISKKNQGIKSLEGSLGVFFGTLFGYYLFAYFVLPLKEDFKAFYSVAIYAFAAMIVEAIAPYNYDNVALPLVMILMVNLEEYIF